MCQPKSSSEASEALRTLSIIHLWQSWEKRKHEQKLCLGLCPLRVTLPFPWQLKLKKMDKIIESLTKLPARADLPIRRNPWIISSELENEDWLRKHKLRGAVWRPGEKRWRAWLMKALLRHRTSRQAPRRPHFQRHRRTSSQASISQLVAAARRQY